MTQLNAILKGCIHFVRIMANPSEAALEDGVPVTNDRSFPAFSRRLSMLTKFSANDMNGPVSNPLK